MAETHFSDEDLTAYLDGACDPDVSERITRALPHDPELAARAALLEQGRDAIGDAFDDLLGNAPPVPVLPVAQTARPARPYGLIAASAAAALVLGLALGMARPSPPLASGWMAYVAAYQALYVPETLAGAQPTDAEQAAQLARLGEVLGLELSLPEIAGLTYARGQVLGFEGSPLVQLAFVTEAGAPVALCIVARPGEAAQAVASARMEGLEAAFWNEDGFGFLLIGTQDADFVARSAGVFAAAL